MDDQHHDDEALVKIRVDAPDDAGISGESFWAKPLGGGLYEVRNMPFFVANLNYGDIVRCDDAGENIPVVVELVEWGGFESFRVYFANHLSMDQELDILRQTGSKGAMYEHGFKGLAMVAVPPSEDAEVIESFLQQEEIEGTLTYEGNVEDDDYLDDV